MHSKAYPDETGYHYPLGDVPAKTLRAFFKESIKTEIFEDASPYIYDKEQDTVVFRQDFGHLNPKAIMPDAEDWVDALRIARATTWTP